MPRKRQTVPQPHEPITDSTVKDLTSKSTHLTWADMRLLIQLRDKDTSQVEMARLLNCSQSTISRNLAGLKANPDITKELMRADTDDCLDEWRTARKQAAKSGNHRPSLEWMQTANPEINPQAAKNMGGDRVVVIIGMPGSPVQLPVIELSPTSNRSIALSPASEIAVSADPTKAKPTPTT